MGIKEIFCNHDFNKLWRFVKRAKYYEPSIDGFQVVQVFQCKKCGKVKEEVIFDPKSRAMVIVHLEDIRKADVDYNKEVQKEYKKIRSSSRA